MPTRTIAWVCVLTLLASAAYADTIQKSLVSRSPAEEALQRGLASAEQGDTASAEAAFRESIRLDPKEAEAYVGMADLAAKRGDAASTEKYLRQALTLEPENGAVQRSWGRYLLGVRRFAEAEATLEAAADSGDAASSLARQDLGNLYLIQNRPSDAVEAFREALTVRPDDAGLHRALGTALAVAGRTSEAEAELGKAAELQPQDLSHRYALGLLYLETRRPSRAVEVFSGLLSARPEDPALLLARGDAHSVSGDSARALTDYQAAARLQSDNAETHFRTGLALLSLGRRPEAQQAFLATIRTNDKHADAFNNLAFLAIERKEGLDQALLWAGKATSLAPHNPSFRDTLAWVHRARGQPETAIRILQQAIQIAPDSPDLLYHLGILQAETGKKQAAAESFQKALNLGAFTEAADARRRLTDLRASL
jgi:Flp pilus assembly protein TadD